MGPDARAYKKFFPQEHIPVILLSIFMAGGNLKKETGNDFEDWLTRRLYRWLKQIPIFRDGPLTIALKAEIVSSDMGVDSHAASGEIDIFVSCGKGVEVYFAIEAKRLRFRSSKGEIISGSSQYIEQGMMRFVSGQYAPCMKAGAMLGYVFDGKTGEARSSIDKEVQNKAVKLKLKPPQKLVQSKILPDKPVHETRHDLEKRNFIIYHVLFAV